MTFIFWALPEDHRKSSCLNPRTRRSEVTAISSMRKRKKTILTYLRSVFCFHIMTSMTSEELWPEKPWCIRLLKIHQYRFRELGVVVQNVLRSPWASFQWNVMLHVPEHFVLTHVHTYIHSVCPFIQQTINGRSLHSASHLQWKQNGTWCRCWKLTLFWILSG